MNRACLILYCFALLLQPPALSAQGNPSSKPAAPIPTLQRFEFTDPDSGIHSVRLLLTLPAIGDAAAIPPRFSVECQEIQETKTDKGRHDMIWSVSFGGIPDPGFVPPFRPTRNDPFPPRLPNVDLRMTFEGYIKSKPFVRSWTELPTGELRYRNPGMSSPNMDSPRWFLAFLNSLPGLRIVHAKPGLRDPGEVYFPTQILLDVVKKTPSCSP